MKNTNNESNNYLGNGMSFPSSECSCSNSCWLNSDLVHGVSDREGVLGDLHVDALGLPPADLLVDLLEFAVEEEETCEASTK